jgi:O-antigen/teichoic acid export membrane protein
LFLHRWSNELYGSWLIFYTIPSYLSFADLGLQSAVGASMSMHVANNRYREAAEELWAYALVLTVVLGVVGSGAVVALDLFPLSRVLHIGAMTPASSMVVGTSLVLYGALAVLSGISSAGYRAVGLFARQLVFVTLASLLDYGVLMGLLLLDGRPAVLAFGLLAMRAVSTCLLVVDFRRMTPWFRLRTAVDITRLRPLVGPSLGYLGFPVGNIVQNQGMLVVAALVAPGQVVLLNTTRTVTNSLYQVGALIVAGATPEFSRILGQGRLAAGRELERMLARTTSVLLGSAGAGILLLGPLALRVWTSGRVTPPYLALAILMVSALTDGPWNAVLPVLTSINRHQRVALTYAISAFMALPVAYLLFRPLGIAGVGIALLTTSVFVTIVAMSDVSRVLREPLRAVYGSFLVTPRQARSDIFKVASQVRRLRRSGSLDSVGSPLPAPVPSEME